MDNSNRQLNFEVLAGGRKGKQEICAGPPWVDILKRAGDLNIQEVADTKESPCATILDLADGPLRD